MALLREMPAQIAPLLDKKSPPLANPRFKVAAFYSISNCEPGLRGVSLGNFLIKNVAQQLQREMPGPKVFCTLSPIPSLASWLLAEPDFNTLPGLRKAQVVELNQARERLRSLCNGHLQALQQAAAHEALGSEGKAALLMLCSAYLLHGSTSDSGDPVARFHLDNGARLERLNVQGNMSAAGLKQSFGMMVNYLYDLDKVESNHAKFRQGEVARSRTLGSHTAWHPTPTETST